MNPASFTFGVGYAAAGLVFSFWNLAEWLVLHRTEPVGVGAFRFTRWQWAGLWAGVLGLGVAIAVWSA